MEKYLDKIICGECAVFMKRLPDNSFDLTITSPPYDNLRNYNGFMLDCENIIKELYRVTKEGGVVVWVVGDAVKKGNKTLTSFKQALMFQNAGFNMHDVMIYKKKNTPFMRSNAYTNCFEFMFVASKGSPKTFRNGFEMVVVNKGANGVCL